MEPNNQWLKVRPAVINNNPAVEITKLSQQEDGLYKRSLYCHLTDLQDGFTGKQISAMLGHLDQLQLYKTDEDEAEVELQYSFIGAALESINNLRGCSPP